jgi:hypothetical protein
VELDRPFAADLEHQATGASKGFGSPVLDDGIA